MMEYRISEFIGKGYGRIWFTNLPRHIRYRVVVGGRSTKKSTDMGAYEPIVKIISSPERNVLFVRLNDTDNAKSTYNRLYWCVSRMGLLDRFWFRHQPNQVIYKPTGQQFMFSGFSNATGLTSTTPPVGALTDVIIEEASEITSFEDFQKLDGSLRCDPSLGVDVQITFLLNPWDINSWIYNVFCKGNMDEDYSYMETHDSQFALYPDFSSAGLFGTGLAIHRSSFRINEWRSPEWDEVARLTRLSSPDIYRTHYLGLWGNTEGATYPEFGEKNSFNLNDITNNKVMFRDFAIGIDTGLSDGQGHVRKDGKVKSAMTAVLSALTMDSSMMVALNEWFFTNEGKDITHRKEATDCAEDMIRWIISLKDRYYKAPVLMKGKIRVYVDSADTEFCSILSMWANRLGLQNVFFLKSTKFSIWARTNFEKTMFGWGCALVSHECPNLIREVRNSTKGEKGEARSDLDDHTINAWEYGWASFSPQIRAWKQFDKSDK